MKRNLAWIVVAISVLSGLFSAGVCAQEKPGSPEATVASFYRWFFRKDAEVKSVPLMDKQIFQYVAKGTVDYLRSQYQSNAFAGDAEYFTNVQDYDGHDWAAHIVMRPAMMLDDVALVAVTFGSVEKKTDIVFLRKIGGVWKITKVVDTQDYR